MDRSIQTPLQGRPIGGGSSLTFADRESFDRAELEAFVADAFHRKHEARVRTFMPVLVGCRDRNGTLRGVVGLRAGSDREPLFLERYLDRPAPELIAAATGRPARRESIVEVGNLAGRNCRAAVRLVSALPDLLLSMNFEWVVFTATTVVRQMIEAFDAPLLELASAGEACVAGGVDDWGRYYTNDPRVCAGHLMYAHRIPAATLLGRSH